MDQAFYCKNGKVAHSLEDLAEILKDMPSDEFSHHVNPFKNDFSNWIMHVLQNPELAGTVRKCNTKEEALAAIKEHMMRKEVSKRLEAYIGEAKVEESMVQQVEIAPVIEVVEQTVKEEQIDKKVETKQQPVIDVSLLEQKRVETKQHEDSHAKKDVYKYFTLKEFILGVLLGFVLGFVVSKLLFSLVLT